MLGCEAVGSAAAQRTGTVPQTTTTDEQGRPVVVYHIDPERDARVKRNHCCICNRQWYALPGIGMSYLIHRRLIAYSRKGKLYCASCRPPQTRLCADDQYQESDYMFAFWV